MAELPGADDRLLKEETLWFPAAIAVASVAAARLLFGPRGGGLARRERVGRALSLFYGWVIATMASGHILVVTILALEGTLSQGLRWFLYPLGLVLAIPGWWLVASAPAGSTRTLAVLNGWLAVTLIPMGPSATLAAPAVLNIVYLLASKRILQRAAVVLTALVYAAMLVAAAVLGGGDFG